MVVVPLNKMDVSRLTFKEPIINPFTKMQHICKITYDDDFLNLQTNYMYQNQHDGIPSIGRFTKDEKARGFYKIIFHNEDDQLMKKRIDFVDLTSLRFVRQLRCKLHKNSHEIAERSGAK